MEILNKRRWTGATRGICAAGLLLAYLGALQLTGCVSGPPLESNPNSPERVLDSLRHVFEAEDREGFLQNVSEHPYFPWTDLQTKLSDQFNRFDHIELRLILDHTLSEVDKLVLKTHWERARTENKTGKRVKDSGRADLVFRIEEDNHLKLIDIQGDSPFAP